MLRHGWGICLNKFNYPIGFNLAKNEIVFGQYFYLIAYCFGPKIGFK